MNESDRQVVRRSGPSVMIFCPGCRHAHAVAIDQPNGNGARWTWNGDVNKPTFSPSILVTTPLWEPPVTPENLDEWKKNPWEQKQVEQRCHSFVRDGMIEFLSDSTHALAGKTVPLEPF